MFLSVTPGTQLSLADVHNFLALPNGASFSPNDPADLLISMFTLPKVCIRLELYDKAEEFLHFGQQYAIASKGGNLKDAQPEAVRIFDRVTANPLETFYTAYFGHYAPKRPPAKGKNTGNRKSSKYCRYPGCPRPYGHTASQCYFRQAMDAAAATYVPQRDAHTGGKKKCVNLPSEWTFLTTATLGNIPLSNPGLLDFPLESSPKRTSALYDRFQIHPSPLRERIAVWRRHLQNFPNQKLAQYVLRGICEGVPLGITTETEPWSSIKVCRKMSTKPSPQNSFIEQEIESEIQAGRMVGPFSTPPFPNFVVNPIFAVPKNNDPDCHTFRRIDHLSHPKGHSVNDHIDKENFPIIFPTID